MSCRPVKSLFFLLLLLTVAASPAFGQKFLSGTIAADMTLDTVGGAVYQVNGAVTVNAGVTLTVDPGVTLKFESGRYLNVYGTLFAEGGVTPANTIVFTSIKDDDAPLGAGEDTNGDGAATSPAVGDWSYIQFLNATSSGSSLRYCTIRYGGSGGNGLIYTSTGAAPTIRDCDLSDGNRGMYIRTNSAPTVRNTSFNRMTTVPVYLSITANPIFENIILDAPSGNAHDAIQLYDGAVAGTGTITRPSATIGGVPSHSLAYWVTSSIQVGVGETLDIEPGVVLKFNPNTHVVNDGLLLAVGGALDEEQIYFTSIDDDNAPAPLGQDTNTNGNDTFPDQNDWGGIRFLDPSDDSSTLEFCRVLFAGYNGASYGAVSCLNASPDLIDCDLTSAYYGVKCTGESDPLLRRTSINAMQDVPIAIEISCNPIFDNLVFESTSDNGFDAIGILGGTLSGANTLSIRGAQLGLTPIDNLVYILLADITVDVSGDLTIDPGIVAKPRANVDLYINGALHLDGTADPDSQIVFTSYKDDNYGNPADTNNDGSNTSPAKGNWGQIVFNDGSAGSVTFATLRFGGYSNSAMIHCKSASPTLANLSISDSYYGIIQAGTSASLVSDVDIANTTYTPFLMSISADPNYTNISFTNVGLRAIGLIGETIGVNSVLRVRSMAGYDNITYYMAGNLTVTTGTHFRMEPGIVLKLATGGYGYDLYIDGSLQAVGTADSTIAFTGINDDSRGNPGDTAGDGANTPAAAQWGYIRFGATSNDAASVIQRCELAYGGSGYSSQPDAAVWCNSASPTISDNDFYTNYMGVYTDGNSAPLVQDNYFFNQSLTPLATSVLSNPNYVGNTFDQNGIHAVGLANETLSADATLEKLINMGLPSYPYYNLGTTSVGTGVTLTVEPGVIVKARASSDIIHVYGALQMVGTPADRIILTSIKDDSQGGDSNVDGPGSSPAAGNWRGMDFFDSTDDAGSLVEECLFRFSGSGNVIDMISAGPTIRNNEFELCTYGLRLRNESNPVIENNLFRVLTWYPIDKSILAQPVFNGNVLDNVNYHCIGIRGESVGQDMTLQKWDFAGYTNITQALIGGNLTVQLGATLTIEPGIVFKLGTWTYYPFAAAINVYGSLVADGTEAEPIIFTSVRDDSVGMPLDTNQDGAGTVPAISNWRYIYFDEVSDDLTSVLDHCELRYGYNYAGNSAMVLCNSASPTISNCRLEYAGHGLMAYGTAMPVISDCVFDECLQTPVLMSLVSDPQFSGNQFLAGNGYNALGIRGETLAQDATVLRRDVAQTAGMPYILYGNLTAGFSSILTIEPGVIIKGNNSNITIRRGLIAEGTADPDGQIVFTSLTDDFFGGDTNNDGGATAPASTRWGRIIIENEAIDASTRLSNAVFRYGYNNATYGTIEINSANPQFDNCIFAYNGVAVDYKGTSGDPAVGWIHDSDFYGNTYYAVRNQGTAFTVDATTNWWGHLTGPLDDSDDTGSGGYYNPGGLGDPVTDRVNYTSWQLTGIQNILLGDVSRNGDIRAYDASLVLQSTVQPPGFLGPLQEVLADVDCNGSIMAMDAALILRFVAGIDTYFPCALDSVVTKQQAEVLAWQNFDPVEFTVDLPSVTLAAEQAAWVPVHIAGSGDVLGQEYHIQFDPAQVVVRDVRLLPSAQGAMLAWNVLNGNELRISLASAESLDVVDAVEFELVGAADLEEPTAADLIVAFARLNDQEFQIVSGIEDLPGRAATMLAQNNPNPFNPSTTIRYTLSDGDVAVRLAVFDTRGRLVRTLVAERQIAGDHAVVWNGRDDAGRNVGSGIYLYRLDVGEQRLVHKMVLLK